MSDEETHHSEGDVGSGQAHQSGWVTSNADNTSSSTYPRPEVRGALRTPPAGWKSANSQVKTVYTSSNHKHSDDLGRPRSSTTKTPARTSSVLRWLAPVIVVLAVLVAVALVIFFKEPGAASTSSGGSPSTKIVRAEQVDPLPQGVTTCTVKKNESSTISEATKATLSQGPFSCGFANTAISEVQDRTQKKPSVTKFSIDPYSQMERRSYTFTCVRRHHLSTCTGRGGDGPLVFSVQDDDK